MKKVVPDPPLFQRVTRKIPITQCPEHDALFCIQSGISAEDALVHAAEMVKFAQITCNLAVEEGEGIAQDYARCTKELLDMCRGLLDSLIDQAEAVPQ